MTKRGFSLIEMLVVFVVIGILASISLSTFNGAKLRSRDSRRKVDLQTVKVAMSIYKRDKASYPNFKDVTDANKDVADCVPGGDRAISWISLQSQLANYLHVIPTDPRGRCLGEHPWTLSNNGHVYVYEINSINPIAYSFWAALENPRDPDRSGGDAAVEGRYNNLFRATPIWTIYKTPPFNFNQNYPNLYGVGCRLPTPPTDPENPTTCVETN